MNRAPDGKENPLTTLKDDIGARPLLVCDVDEVILQFIEPFKAFLKANDHELVLRSFSLNGNVTSVKDGATISNDAVGTFLTAFYDAQEEWQKPFDEALETLTRLQEVADVLLLTAMPPRHRTARERLLKKTGFVFPMIASEKPKGDVLSELFETHPPAVIFIDDMHYNCRSVAETLPEALIVNLLIDNHYRQIAPQTEPPAVRAASWKDTEHLIRQHIAENT